MKKEKIFNILFFCIGSALVCLGLFLIFNLPLKGSITIIAGIVIVIGIILLIAVLFYRNS